MRVWLSTKAQTIQADCYKLYRRHFTLNEALHLGTRANGENARQGQRQRLTPKPHSGPPSTSPQAIHSRHLLRAILRECTYLPDPSARQWVFQHTLSRFREYSFKAWKNRDNEDFRSRLDAKDVEARKALSLLQRANEGERKCLLKVLLMAYGRIGKRRHELMRPLLPVKGQSGENGVEDVQAADSEDVGEVLTREDGADEVQTGNDIPSESLSPTNLNTSSPILKHNTPLELPPQLCALLQSQIQTSPPALTRPNPRRLQPLIPEFNTWLRPMPQKRIRNMRKKHYALLLNRLLPPLPTEEWMRLKGLATGTLAVEPPISRRRLAGSNAGGVGVGSALETVVRYGKLPERVFENIRAHEISRRFMRRLYVQVFCQCPLMEWNVETEDWKITWGERALHDGRLETGRRDEGNDTAVKVEQVVAE